MAFLGLKMEDMALKGAKDGTNSFQFFSFHAKGFSADVPSHRLQSTNTYHRGLWIAGMEHLDSCRQRTSLVMWIFLRITNGK